MTPMIKKSQGELCWGLPNQPSTMVQALVPGIDKVFAIFLIAVSV